MAANKYTPEELYACIVRENGVRLTVLRYEPKDTPDDKKSMPGLWLWNPKIKSQAGVQLGAEWEAPLAQLVYDKKLRTTQVDPEMVRYPVVEAWEPT